MDDMVAADLSAPDPDTADMVTEDGCPVEAYAAMPPEPELGEVLRRLPEGTTTVLDLGCGAGRIANPLATAGFRVTGVDSSPRMLAHLRDVDAVQSQIQGLELGRSFTAVLLLSNLVNTVDVQPLLRAARRHLAQDGRLVAQRLPTGVTWRPTSHRVGPVQVDLEQVSVTDGLVTATSVYRLGERAWPQHWQLLERDDDQITRELEAAGFTEVGCDGVWVTARG